MQADAKLIHQRFAPMLGNIYSAARGRTPDPLQIEEAPGERHPERSRYMVTPLAPVDMMRHNQRPASLEERAIDAEIGEPAPAIISNEIAVMRVNDDFPLRQRIRERDCQRSASLTSPRRRARSAMARRAANT